MSVRYPEHDCFEDYEEDNIDTEDLTKEDMIDYLIEFECQNATVNDLLNCYFTVRLEEFYSLPEEEIIRLYGIIA